jgi:methionine-rich copper-binding protein CopC
VGRTLFGVGTRALAPCVVLGCVAVALLTVGAAPALAHNSLIGSNPADGATVARPPATVRLTFLARLDPATTKISVTGPDGASAAGGAPAYARNRVAVPFRAGAAGRYTIAYEVASDDGHPLRGRVGFTVTSGAAPVAPTAAATPAPSAASPAATVGSPAPDASAAPAALSATAGDEDAGGTLGWMLGGLALVLLLAAGAFLLRRRTRA